MKRRKRALAEGADPVVVLGAVAAADVIAGSDSLEPCQPGGNRSGCPSTLHKQISLGSDLPGVEFCDRNSGVGSSSSTVELLRAFRAPNRFGDLESFLLGRKGRRFHDGSYHG